MSNKNKFNAYRDGKVHVQAKMCSTCIFRPDSLVLEPDRLKAMVDKATNNQTAIICHSTLKKMGGKNQAVCRGFYDRHMTVPLAVARAMGAIEFSAENL